MDKWLVEVFDYTLKRYTGTYRPLASINAFVDSELWSDSIGTWTSTNPRKTIAKVKASGATYRASWKIIMVNWYFDEITTINVNVRIIWAGGGIGGRAIFAGNITGSFSVGTATVGSFDNLIVYRNGNHFLSNAIPIDSAAYFFTTYNSNCIWINRYEHWDRSAHIYEYSYYSVFNTCYNYGFGSARLCYRDFYWNNNTIYNCSTRSGYQSFYWQNNHCNNGVVGYNYNFYNLTNTNGAYLDVTNLNFNFLVTSPLYKTGSFNGITQDYNHIWAGTVARDFKATTTEFNDAGTATYTNLTKSWWDIYRPNVAIDWTMVSGLINLWEVKENVFRDIYNSYEQTAGKMYRRMQQNTQVSARQWRDYLVQYGNNAQEVVDCPQLKCEYWKIIRVSWAWVSRVWNADPTFDIANFTTPSFQYCKVYFRFKTVT